MPNPFDQFDDIGAPPPKAVGKNPFDQFDAGIVEDVAKTIPSAAVRGTSYLYGLPGSMQDFADYSYGQTVGRVANKLKNGTWNAQTSADVKARRDDLPGRLPDAGDVMRSDKMVHGVESVTGPLYKPKTTPGEYTNTAVEFLPSMALGGTLPQTLAAAAGSETLGQVARRVAPDSPKIEAAARFGGAVVGGGAAALHSMPHTADMAISRALSSIPAAERQGVIQQAGGLIQDAAGMGTRLTWDEAIQQVTGGATRLGDLRRVVENSRGGGDVMKPLMAERPGQVQAAGDAAIGALAPNRMDPVRAGLANQRGATQELADAQTAVNAATRTEYTRAGRERVGVPVLQALEDDPLYVQAFNEVRGNPALNRGIENLPNDNVQVLDLVQRRMRERAANARVPGQADSSNLAAMNLEDARTAPITAAERVTGGIYGDYANARNRQATLRENFLEPLTEGPLGQVGKTNDVLAQGRAVLPSTPATGGEQVVRETVSRLARQNPEAVSNLVHSHVRAAFDEATQNLASGPNQFGGAKFASIVAGNGQQARNLEAAVTSLPNGDARWQGFRRFLDVMEATGQRPQQGSATAFNTEIQREMKQGGLIQEGAAAAKTGGMSMLRRFQDYRETMNLGRNTEQIARILTDPQSGRLLERMAAAPQSQLPVLALRLSYMGRSGVGFGPRGYRSSPEQQSE